MNTPKKSKQLLIILVNTNSYNIWITQPLLAADIVEADHCPWDYTTIMSQDGEEIKIGYHQIPSAVIQEEILSSTIQQEDPFLENQTHSEESESKPKENPKFGPPLNFDSPTFNFKEELEKLPFVVNIGDIEMSFKQEKWFLSLIYDHHTVFSLHDEDLGLCVWLKHTTPTITDTPIIFLIESFQYNCRKKCDSL